MATYLELQTRAKALVDDESLHDIIDSLLNQGVNEIAGGMQSTLGDWITPPLPNLFSIESVTTDVNLAYVDMPNTYHRNLQLVVSSAGREIDIANSFIAFSEIYPALDKSGNITEIAVQGNTLYYQGIPTEAEEVTLHFYRKPVDMTADDDIPDGIPSHLHYELLVNFACWKAYELLEDGLEGDIPNTLKFKTSFLEALRTLELSIPHDVRGITLR